MGIYLLIVASHDVKFRDQYNRYANGWLNSWGCQATGFIAMVSSEVSSNDNDQKMYSCIVLVT